MSPFARRLERPAIAIGILVTLCADVFVLTQHNRTTPVTMSDSLSRFRASRSSTTTTSTASTPALQPTTTAPGPSAATAHAPSTPNTVARRPGVAPAVRDAPPAPRPFVTPGEGVYGYATKGYEEISLGGSRHNFPAESFATVRRGDGCHWDFEHRVIQEHVETLHFCGLPNVAQFLGEQDQETFYGQTNSVTLTCAPPETLVTVGDPPGTKRTFACSLNDGSKVDETVTYLGRETLTVDGAPVETFHYLIDGRESGNVEGTSRVEDWIHPLDALPVRELVHVQSRSHSFGADVDYQEDASYTLERLAPRS